MMEKKQKKWHLVVVCADYFETEYDGNGGTSQLHSYSMGTWAPHGGKCAQKHKTFPELSLVG